MKYVFLGLISLSFGVSFILTPSVSLIMREPSNATNDNLAGVLTFLAISFVLLNMLVIFTLFKRYSVKTTMCFVLFFAFMILQLECFQIYYPPTDLDMRVAWYDAGVPSAPGKVCHVAMFPFSSHSPFPEWSEGE